MSKILEQIITQVEDDEILGLLKESGLCYRVEAYRASLLLAWLGLMKLVRYRILNSTKPSEVEQGEWENLQRKLYRDDQWEETAYKQISRQDRKILKTSDALRKDIEYWRNRRNDVAHAKSSTITSSHIDTFYIFILDNLYKINTKESSEHLIDEIDTHYNPTYTRPGEDPTYLIQKIVVSIPETEIIDFLKKLDSNFVFREDLFVELVKRLLHHSNDNSFNNKVLDFIRADNSRLLEHLCSHPQDLTSLLTLETFRPFWNNTLKSTSTAKPYYLIKKMFEIGWISDDDKETLFDKMVEKVWGRIPDDLYEYFNDIDYPIYFLGKAFTSQYPKVNSFSWLNLQNELVGQILSNEYLNIEIVRKLSRAMDQDNYSWHFETYLSNNNEEVYRIKRKLILIAEEAGKTLSDRLQCSPPPPPLEVENETTDE
jgi:hypothetical protein